MNHLFMAELAEAAGISPLTMMENLLDADALPPELPSREFEVLRVRRQRRLLQEVVARGGMPGAMGERAGRGFAVADMSYLPGHHSTCIAMTMEVSLDDKNWPRVSRVVAVVDCGLAVNPKIVEAQVEGGILFGLSNALRAEITLEAGRVVQQNFDDYPLLRIHEAPRVEVHILPASEKTPTGIGEGTVPVVIAALVMSIRAAGGPWVRRLPVAAAQV
jgi:isoquinoline 1-oxidoreductase beta subunit